MLPSVKLKANLDGRITSYKKSKKQVNRFVPTATKTAETDTHRHNTTWLHPCCKKSKSTNSLLTNGRKTNAMPKNSSPSNVMATKYLNRAFLNIHDKKAHCFRHFFVDPSLA